jgi:sphingolipid delta-4 desaturase
MAHERAQRDWHRMRAGRIIRDHPAIRALQGPAPISALLIATLVTVQTALAIAVSGISWAGVVAAAWVFGAIPALGLFVLLHEGAHGLVLRSRIGNEAMMVLCTAPLLLPWADGFRHYHLEHHRALGVADRDADIPSAWEERLLRSRGGRVVWLAAWPFVQMARLRRCRPHPIVSPLFLANSVFNVAFAVGLLQVGGPKAIAFCGLSIAFAFGLHPLAGRMIQEHFRGTAVQPTASYYGGANRLLFNAGYHVEHHDFMGVAWLHLPKIRTLAGEHYAALECHRSWSATAARFVWRGLDSQASRAPGEEFLAPS